MLSDVILLIFIIVLLAFFLTQRSYKYPKRCEFSLNKEIYYLLSEIVTGIFIVGLAFMLAYIVASMLVMGILYGGLQDIKSDTSIFMLIVSIAFFFFVTSAGIFLGVLIFVREMLFNAILLGGLLGGVLWCLFTIYKSGREQMLWSCYKGILFGGVLGGINVAFFFLFNNMAIVPASQANPYLWRIGLITMLLSGLIGVYLGRQKATIQYKKHITNKMF
jgi:hypothetical protein